jgi:hypothetical protein
MTSNTQNTQGAVYAAIGTVLVVVLGLGGWIKSMWHKPVQPPVNNTITANNTPVKPPATNSIATLQEQRDQLETRRSAIVADIQALQHEIAHPIHKTDDSKADRRQQWLSQRARLIRQRADEDVVISNLRNNPQVDQQKLQQQHTKVTGLDAQVQQLQLQIEWQKLKDRSATLQRGIDDHNARIEKLEKENTDKDAQIKAAKPTDDTSGLRIDVEANKRRIEDLKKEIEPDTAERNGLEARLNGMRAFPIRPVSDLDADLQTLLQQRAEAQALLTIMQNQASGNASANATALRQRQSARQQLDDQVKQLDQQLNDLSTTVVISTSPTELRKQLRAKGVELATIEQQIQSLNDRIAHIRKGQGDTGTKR